MPSMAVLERIVIKKGRQDVFDFLADHSKSRNLQPLIAENKIVEQGDGFYVVHATELVPMMGGCYKHANKLRIRTELTKNGERIDSTVNVRNMCNMEVVRQHYALSDGPDAGTTLVEDHITLFGPPLLVGWTAGVARKAHSSLLQTLKEQLEKA